MRQTTAPGLNAPLARVNLIAVTGKQRLPMVPDTPTMAEAGLPGFESLNWNGLVGPANIPRDVLTVCLGKSTYARCGIIVNVTPFEPEWEGHVTIEISNTTPLPAKIYANEGIAQVLFFQSDEQCEISYKDKKGKYQAQRGVTLPKI